jgi:hypothetical protein
MARVPRNLETEAVATPLDTVRGLSAAAGRLIVGRRSGEELASAAAGPRTPLVETTRRVGSPVRFCGDTSNAFAVLATLGNTGVVSADPNVFSAVTTFIRGCRSNDHITTAPMAIPPPKDATRECHIGVCADLIAAALIA